MNEFQKQIADIILDYTGKIYCTGSPHVEFSVDDLPDMTTDIISCMKMMDKL